MILSSMRLLAAALVISRPFASNAFAPPVSSTAIRSIRSTSLNAGFSWWPFGREDKEKQTALIPDEEPSSEGGSFTSDLLGDTKSKEEIEEENKSLIGRVGKMGVNAIMESAVQVSEEEEQAEFEMRAEGVFRYMPPKDMTGVDPRMSRLCSTISEQLYSKTSFDQFKLSTSDMKTDLFIYDDHGDFLDATPPFLTAITGKTMILGWRGTGTLMDAVNDAAASPQSSLAWRKHAKTIKAQGAMTSICHNDIVVHQKAIIAKAKREGITEIITTGQSLGGGLAQIAHLTLRALIEDETSEWNELEGVNVRSVAFCGPMTTVLVGVADPETDAFVEKLWNNSCNFVYKNDPVPRGYGYLSFIEDFIDNSLSDVAKKVPVNRVVRRILDLEGRLENIVEGAKDNESLVGLLGVFSQYRHMGNLIYYEDENAKPKVLTDKGAFYKNTKGETNLFRSVKYKPVRSPLSEVMGWHMDIIRAPGLSFPEDQLS